MHTEHSTAPDHGADGTLHPRGAEHDSAQAAAPSAPWRPRVWTVGAAAGLVGALVASTPAGLSGWNLFVAALCGAGVGTLAALTVGVRAEKGGA